MKNLKFILIVAIIIISYVLLHEATHYFIYDQFGCNNINIKYRSGFAMTTASCNNINDAAMQNMKLSHSINEIIGYNITPILMLLLIIKCHETLF